MATESAAAPEAHGYVEPTIDVAALARLLDGSCADVRDLVRTNLVTYASVLDEAESMSRDDFRGRVRELVVELAATGQTGMGFPEEYGGGGDIGASIAAFETLALGDLSVFSRVQDHVIGAATAHVERLVLDAFVEKCRAAAADRDSGPDTGVALGLLCDLFALTTIESDRAWFMEHGRLSSARSKAITREVKDLCRKIRPLAQDYVDALGVPRALLRAPDLLGPA